jgi:SAM-dependent methyltransferase
MNTTNSDFEQVPCNLCGVENYEIIFIAKDWFFQLPGEFPVVKCKNCGLVYLNPRLTTEAMVSYYPKNYYTHNPLIYNKNYSNLVVKIKETAKYLVLDCYERERKWKFFIIALFWKYIHTKGRWGLIGERGKLLDLGCGNGGYLQSINQDWLVGKKIECVGVDPDKEAIKHARKIGLKVKEGTIETAAFPDSYFDIVRINHTIEHISEPLGTLKEVYRIIKPGGKVIIEVPNFDSVGRKLLKDKWAGIDAPRHYFEFSPVTLKRMLVLSGFQPLSIAKWHGMYCRKLSLEWVNKYWKSVGVNEQKRRIKFIQLSALLWLLDRFCRGGAFSIKAGKI